MSARRVLIGAGLIAAASLWMRAGFPVKAMLFALLAFNPVLWYSELARVIRE